MWMSIWRATGAIAVALATAAAQAAGVSADAAELLARSDAARGGNAQGMVWEVRVSNAGENAQGEDMRMRIKTANSASLAETLEPLKSKGAKMLQVDRNMWLSKPGLKKPIPISARQRLTGLASIGDIAATNYARDYNAVLLRQDTYKAEPCYVLELSARERQTTYDKLVYWISVERSLGVFAEFLSLSGKRLKVAEFSYDNTVVLNGRRAPFISRMTISDELTHTKTTLEYGQVKLQPIPSSEFDVTHLE